MKLLVDEIGSDEAEALWNDAAPAAASRLVVPEVSAALAAARRAGRLDAAAHRVSQQEWARYTAEVDFVELTPALAERSAALATEHDLSGADAVHLATALQLRDPSVVVATWDRRLAGAANAEGLVVIPQST